MQDSNTARLLTLPNAGQAALSIRAKALIFHDAKSLRLLRDLSGGWSMPLTVCLTMTLAIAGLGTLAGRNVRIPAKG